MSPLGQLYQSPPSPIPGDWARGKQRGFSPGVAARHSQSARIHSDKNHEKTRFFGLSLEKEEKGEGEKRKERKGEERRGKEKKGNERTFNDIFGAVFGRKQIGLSRLNPIVGFQMFEHLESDLTGSRRKKKKKKGKRKMEVICQKI